MSCVPRLPSSCCNSEDGRVATLRQIVVRVVDICERATGEPTVVESVDNGLDRACEMFHQLPVGEYSCYHIVIIRVIILIYS